MAMRSIAATTYYIMANTLRTTLTVCNQHDFGPLATRGLLAYEVLRCIIVHALFTDLHVYPAREAPTRTETPSLLGMGWGNLGLCLGPKALALLGPRNQYFYGLVYTLHPLVAFCDLGTYSYLDPHGLFDLLTHQGLQTH
jgi:hypothetical protein